MKWFMNMKISTKLLASFILVAIIAGIVGVVGIVNMKTIDKSDTELYENMTVPISEVANISIQFQRSRVNVRDMVISNDPAIVKANSDNIADRQADIAKNLEFFNKTILSTSMRGLYDDLVTKNTAYVQQNAKVRALATQSKTAEAIVLMGETGSAGIAAKELQASIDSIITAKLDEAKLKSETNSKTANSGIVTMIIVIIVGALTAIGLGVFISSIISKPINELVKVAEKIADGDLDVDVEAKTTDEIGLLASAFKRMAENLNEVMSNFDSASEQVASGSRQVSASSMALAQGATEQASSIEELTASIEEISTQTMLNAQNSTQANELAEAARENAIQGNEQMKEMLKAMEEINDSSGNIFKIIKVIDEIAFQTNILALNAAVEAARAGQHGKGFAVVAEEVRNLAARSASAAKETTAMIEGSIKKVEGGTKIANDTAAALSQIVEGVTKVTDLVGEIATASNEQALGINQVNQGILQVSDVVQTNSATSEESASASEELSSQAELLREQVAKFKLKKNTGSAYRGLDDLNPEVLRMLEEMSNKKKGIKKPTSSKGQIQTAATSKKLNISLSDRDFGKY